VYKRQDYLLGSEASKRHGYTILMIFWYPIMVLTYLLLTWVTILIIKNKIK